MPTPNNLFKPRFVNAYKKSLLHDDFYFPNKYDIENIVQNDYVKLSYNHERFYVKVYRIFKNKDYTKIKYYGIVANKLINNTTFNKYDIVQFFSKDVFDIQSAQLNE